MGGDTVTGRIFDCSSSYMTCVCRSCSHIRMLCLEVALMQKGAWGSPIPLCPFILQNTLYLKGKRLFYSWETKAGRRRVAVYTPGTN